MGNGYGIPVYGVIDTFLLKLTEYNKREQSCRRTNLRNIVQNSDERVTILKSSRHFSFSINSHKKVTYFRSTRNSCHLYLIVSAIVRVVWKGFCSSSNRSGPEEDALCSETPDEDALIRDHGWILLYHATKKKVSACRGNVGWGTDWIKTTVVMRYGSSNVAPNETRPTVIERSACQRNLSLHIVVHERSGGP